MSKKKKAFLIFIVLVIILVCIFSGLKARERNKIVVTQLAGAGEGSGYILTTIDNNIVIIDGGNSDNAERLKEIISKHDNLVTAWIITSPEEEKMGAFAEIIKENNSNIRINNILHNLSLVDEDYDILNIEDNEIEKMKDDINSLLLSNYRDSLVEMGKRSVYQFDNFYITPLEIANWESSNIEDKRTILKIDNTFKNILLLNDINEENSNNFIENNKDMFDCEAVMFYGNESSELKIMQYIKPKIIFTSNKQNYENSKFDIITKEDGEITKEVW